MTAMISHPTLTYPHYLARFLSFFISQLTVGLQALGLKAQYESLANNELGQEQIVDQMKTLLGANPSDACVQLTASHMLFKAGQTKEAMSAIASSSGPSLMEHSLMKLQILLKIDRVDLAKQTLERELNKFDDESILAQLGSVYVCLASGSSRANDAVHALHSLSEQYGPSPMLLNLLACAYMQNNDFAQAGQKLQECLRDHSELVLPDTLINLIACSVQTQNAAEAETYLQQLRQQYPQHSFLAGYDRVNQAFDREAIKYQV